MDQIPPLPEQPAFGAGIPNPLAGRRGGSPSSDPQASRRPSRDGDRRGQRRAGGKLPEAAAALARLRELANEPGLERPAGGSGEPRVGAPIAAKLLEALAHCAGDSPSASEVEKALRRSSADAGLARSPLYGYRPHLADPPAEVFARIAVALDRRAGVLAVLQPESARRWRAGLEYLAEATARHGLEIVVDDHLDAVRILAGASDIAVDVALPTAFSSGHGEALIRTREEAAVSARDDAPAPPPEADIGWFGAGIVEAPTPPLRILEAVGRTAYYGVGVSADPSHLGTVEPLVLDGALDPMEAAEELAEAAFGKEVLGGYGTHSVSRAVVRADRLSVFTECLLEVLEDGFGVAPLGPPSWATEAPGRWTSELDPGLQAARRIGSDEGSTLIFESRRAGKRALVFTNVERRMRLGGGLKAPAVLALMRG